MNYSKQTQSNPIYGERSRTNKANCRAIIGRHIIAACIEPAFDGLD